MIGGGRQLTETCNGAAAAVLWGLRPRTMAKFVGPEHKGAK
jgi:hypothetical protein